MRAASYALIVLGVVIALIGAVNKFILKLNPVPHTTTVLVVVGAVLFVVGLIVYFMGSRSAAS